ncbi:MFS transporter [Tengunoibacter tsumagoiensis]|uniref:MFS transporter n=1 Tax=Tengunoibacter tsumagoiensis TaxID=2014871 RepID=A0A402A0V9_9CHLR|nr:MFS transporter [Tengunoibacter tsumagoiensis]GCE12692.1 MFS transporter [Tengunoibacter tsumagoiensis]
MKPYLLCTRKQSTRQEKAVSEQEAMVKRTGWQRAFTSLQQRNFRLFWSGQSISLLGTMMQSIGQTWLVWERTHSSWQIGLVGALQALPILFFSIFGGVVADRWPKRRILLFTQYAAMCQSLLLWLLVVTGSLQLWQLYLLVLLSGLTNSLGKPVSRSFIVELVGSEDLPNAYALSSSFASLARIAGPALGGLIIASTDFTVLFLLNALSFLPIIISLSFIQSHELHSPASQDKSMNRQQNTWHSLHQGLSYVWHTPEILMLTLVVGLVLLFGSNFGVILPSIATNLLHAGSSGLGFLSAATGIGALLAAIWLAWSNQRSTLRGVLLIMLIFALLEVAFSFSHHYYVSLLLMTSIGFTEELFAMQSIATLQIITPRHLNGRVTSVQVLLFDGSLPLGYLLMGWLSATTGAPTALLIGALICLLVVICGWIYARRASFLILQSQSGNLERKGNIPTI